MLLLILAVIFLVTMVVLVSLAIGLALLLHLIFPAVNLGVAIMIGLLAVALSLHFTGRLLGILPGFREDEIDAMDEIEVPVVSKSASLRPRTRRRK